MHFEMRRDDTHHMVGKLLWKSEGLMVKCLKRDSWTYVCTFFWNLIIGLMSVHRTYNVMNVGRNLSVTQYIYHGTLSQRDIIVNCSIFRSIESRQLINLYYFVIIARWHEWAVNMSTWYNHLQPRTCHPRLIITVWCWH